MGPEQPDGFKHVSMFANYFFQISTLKHSYMEPEKPVFSELGTQVNKKVNLVYT